MENEYTKEIERLKAECQKWESNYIIERDNAIALRAELDKLRDAWRRRLPYTDESGKLCVTLQVAGKITKILESCNNKDSQ